MQIRFIVYVSSAVSQLGRDELLALMNECRTRNAQHGVTGMLLYKGGNFMQALEGDEADVQAVYAKIARDPRHTGLIVVDEGHHDLRQFPDWAMGFENLDAIEAAAVPGYSRFLSKQLTSDEFAKDNSGCWALLNLFKNTM
jgi:hypothetical protein